MLLYYVCMFIVSKYAQPPLLCHKYIWVKGTLAVAQIVKKSNGNYSISETKYIKLEYIEIYNIINYLHSFGG